MTMFRSREYIARISVRSLSAVADWGRWVVRKVSLRRAGARGGLVEGVAWHLVNNPPLTLFLLIIIACMGFLLLLQLLLQQEIYFINKVALGLDYGAVQEASKIILSGGSPYDPPLLHPYPNPPIPAIVNIPLAYTPHYSASLFIALLSYVSVVASMFIIHRVFTVSSSIQSNPADSRSILLLFMLIPMYSYPFYFLFDRGNVDGITLLFTCLSIAFLAGKSLPSKLLSGFFLITAVSIKVYPVLVVLPLIAMRRWITLAAATVTFLCFFLITPELWIDWFEWMRNDRVSQFWSNDNGSLANTFLHIGWFFDYGRQFKGSAFAVWGALLLIMFCVDFMKMPLCGKGHEYTFASLLLYLPFMVAVPQMAYHYELVFLLAVLPAVSYLWVKAVHRNEKRVLLFITIGLGLSQFQAVAMEKLLTAMVLPHWIAGGCAPQGFSFGGDCLPQLMPGLGLFIVMIGAVLYKVLYLYRPLPGSGDERGSRV